ncbi:MAG: hypothetical protein ABJC04_12185, partial [Verrucomicrobiota bacterium]
GGGDGGEFIVSANNNIFVGENISATTGLNDPNGGPAFSGRGGQVTLRGGAVTVNSTILVSSDDNNLGAAPVGGGTPAPFRGSARGGDITIQSGRTTGTSINLSNTSGLLSYLSDFAPGPGGTIRVTSEGGDIFADGAIIADRGTIIISNVGSGGRPRGVGFPNPLISLTGSFVYLRSETLDITSAGDIELGISGEFLDLGSVVSVAISAVNDITGGFVYSGGGKGGPVTARASDGNFSLTAQGAITLDGLAAGRANSGRTNGINLTVDAGTSLSLGSLDLNTVTGGLTAGGDIAVRSGTDAQIDFVSLQTDVDTTTGGGGSILFESGGNLNAASFTSRTIVEAPLGSGANVTLNVGGDAVFADQNGGGDLNLSVGVFNSGALNTGGNITGAIGGSLTAYSLSAVVDGYDVIANGGNIDLNITGDLVVGSGDALLQILAQTPIARDGAGVGPTLNLSAANIRVGEADVGGNFIAYIDESGLGTPSGQTAGSVLIQSTGTIDLPFGALDVLGTVSAGGDINAYVVASTNVISATSIHADFGGIRRFRAFAPFGTPPIDFLHTLTAPIVSSFGGIDFNGQNAFLSKFGSGIATDGGALTINADSLTFGSGPTAIGGSVTLNGGNGDGFSLGG